MKKLIALMIFLINFNTGQTYIDEPTTVENAYVFNEEEYNNLIVKLHEWKLTMDSLNATISQRDSTLMYADSLIATQDSLIAIYEDYNKPWWAQGWVERVLWFIGGALINNANWR